MARIFTEGFEMGDGLFWTSPGGAASTSSPRSGAYCYRVDNAYGTYSYVSITALSEFHFRCAFKWTNTGGNNFFVLRSGGSVLAAMVLNGGNISHTYGTGSTSLSTGTWYRIEVYFKAAVSGGRYAVKVDGNVDIDYTGNTGATSVDNFGFQTNNNGVGNMYVDDFALNDTTGGADNSWCGDGHIVALTPNANGDTNQFTGSDGNSTDNYLLVDEIPNDGDTTYTEDGTAGHQDMYNMSAWDDSSGTVSPIRVWAEARMKDTVGGNNCKIGVKTGGSVTLSSAISLGASYAVAKSQEFITNPTSAVAWTKSDCDAVQFVVEAE